MPIEVYIAAVAVIILSAWGKIRLWRWLAEHEQDYRRREP